MNNINIIAMQHQLTPQKENAGLIYTNAYLRYIT